MKHKLVFFPLMGCICTFGFISEATHWHPLIRQVKCRSSNEFCSTPNRSAAQLRRKLWRMGEAIGVRVENERAETSSLPRSPLPRLQPKPTYQRSFLSCGKLAITLKPLLPKGYHNLLSMHNGNRSNISSTQQDKHAVGARRGVSEMVCGRRGAKEEVR